MLKLTKLKQNVNLEKLYFQEVSGGAANPICKIENYRSEIIKLVPSLKSLDGVNKQYDPINLKDNSFNIDLSKMDPKNFTFNFKESKFILIWLEIDLNFNKLGDEETTKAFAERFNNKYNDFAKELEESKKALKKFN